MASNTHHFIVGGHGLTITFAHDDSNNIGLLPSFEPFRADSIDNTLLSLTVDDTLQPAKEKTLIRAFDTGNGDTIVYMLPDGGYQYVIKNIDGKECCLLITNRDFNQCKCALKGNRNMRAFGLNDALMLAYAFAGSFHHTLLIHASTIGYKNRAYPFTAKSGTGKSTHAALWMQNIEDCELINDDNPILRFNPGQKLPTLYGSPWSGKTPCYRNISMTLGAITQIERAKENSIRQLPTIEAFATMLPMCSTMKWDSRLNDNLCETLSKIIETTPIYTLYCLPNAEAAQLSCNTIAKP